MLLLLFFLLPMQMKTNAFSVRKLPLHTCRQGSRRRARQACKRLQADAEPCAETSTQTPVPVSGGHKCVRTWGCRAETLAKKPRKPQCDCSCLLLPKGSAPLLLPAAMPALPG